MRCICPMGGERECPPDCTPAHRKAHRKTIAEQLYRDGKTMEQIAVQLDVGKSTIARDIEEFSHDGKTEPRTSERGRKGEGRPKGAKKSAPSETVKQREARNERIVDLHDQGFKTKEIAEKVKLGERNVSQIIEHEKIRREATPEIDPASLSMKAQEKLNAAMRQMQRKLGNDYERTVREAIEKGVTRRMNEIALPQWREQVRKAEDLYNRRKGIMDKATFDGIRSVLHPDSRKSISDQKLGEAFDKFMSLEKYLLDEKASPTSWPDVPSTVEEWEKMRQRPKRPAGQNAVRPR